MTVRRRGAVRQDVGEEEKSPGFSGLMNNGKSITRREAIKLGGVMIAAVLGGVGVVHYRLLSTGHVLQQAAAQPAPISDKLYPGDETLPDLSGVTFDHIDVEGKQVRFLWGVATSAYQVEGNVTTNDWDYFTHSSAIRARVEAISHIGNADIKLGGPGIAADHWDLGVFGQDLQRASDLGINAYRFSLEWSRIQPNRPASIDPGVPYGEADYDSAAIVHYQEMLAMIRGKGMEPIVTLNHFTLPKWVLTPPTSTFDNKEFQASLRGWENEATIDAFVKFVQLVVPNFKDDVGYWVTLNEPTGVMG